MCSRLGCAIVSMVAIFTLLMLGACSSAQKADEAPSASPEGPASAHAPMPGADLVDAAAPVDAVVDDTPLVPVDDVDEVDMPFMELDSRASSDTYGVEIEITGDGYYTFRVTGEDKAPWSIYVVTAAELAENGGPCRLIAQGCDALPQGEAVPIKKGSLVCAIPAVNALTIQDSSDLLEVGESVLHVTRKGAVLASGRGCKKN